MKLATQLFKLQYFIVQLFPGGFVTARYLAAEFQQQPHQGPIADPQAQNSNGLVPEARKIVFKSIHSDTRLFRFYNVIVYPTGKDFARCLTIVHS